VSTAARPVPESLPDLIEAVNTGRRTITDVIESCLAAYAIWEPQLHAFAWLDPDHVRMNAREADKIGSQPKSVLRGVPVGVKDIFDTAGIPTEYGSPVFNGRVPTKTATAVSRLEAAGAIVFGKTVTAELAYFAPGPSTNPWDSSRTPGGSSMGSAAAVAAGVIPCAIGSQTNGSVIRPAAFCGVVGFKPTAGRLPTMGALRFSPSLDQVGVFSKDVLGSAWLAAIIAGETPATWCGEEAPAAPAHLAFVRSPEWEAVEPAAQLNFDLGLDALRAAGADLAELDLPPELAKAVPVHRTIMAAEAHRNISPLVARHRDLVSPQLLALLDEGAAVSETNLTSALRNREELRAQYEQWFAGFDAIVTPPVSGEAPDIATTGSPTFCTRWTLIGAPALTLPSGLGPSGLPLGMQLAGRLQQDSSLIRVARWVESTLPPAARPPAPRSRP
jgi:Asp-tRNA(Asn)/Glu-tRNA(Gln) amidotransferase A subunit family amidase